MQYNPAVLSMCLSRHFFCGRILQVGIRCPTPPGPRGRAAVLGQSSQPFGACACGVPGSGKYIQIKYIRYIFNAREIWSCSIFYYCFVFFIISWSIFFVERCFKIWFKINEMPGWGLGCDRECFLKKMNIPREKFLQKGRGNFFGGKRGSLRQFERKL